MIRAAVERGFITIGEALNNLSRVDSGVFARIDQAVRIISFRNKLTYVYDRVDDALVWGVIQSYLQPLRSACLALAARPMPGAMRCSPGLLHSRKQLLKFISGLLSITQDFGKQPRSQRFTRMNRNYSSAAIGMSQKMMTSLYSQNLEANLSKCQDERLACDSGIC